MNISIITNYNRNAHLPRSQPCVLVPLGCSVCDREQRQFLTKLIIIIIIITTTTIAAAAATTTTTTTTTTITQTQKLLHTLQYHSILYQ